MLRGKKNDKSELGSVRKLDALQAPRPPRRPLPPAVPEAAGEAQHLAEAKALQVGGVFGRLFHNHVQGVA